MRILNKAVSNPRVIDPSELLRPEQAFADKPIGAFRDYSINVDDPLKERVRLTYLKMHTNQTVDFVKDRMDHWLKFNTFKSTMMDALVRLNDLIDESDPDVNIPNIVHAFQTAERIRAEYPDDDWFQLTGLIHDAGKVMAFYGEPQWAVVGDTFPVGCAWAESIVYSDTSFAENPDDQNPKYNSKYGIYKPNCGLDNVLMSWGHDEYLYRLLMHNKTTLPEKALYMIKYHSFYPWHCGGDYDYLCNENDLKMKSYVLEFNEPENNLKMETQSILRSLLEGSMNRLKRQPEALSTLSFMIMLNNIEHGRYCVDNATNRYAKAFIDANQLTTTQIGGWATVADPLNSKSLQKVRILCEHCCKKQRDTTRFPAIGLLVRESKRLWVSEAMALRNRVKCSECPNPVIVFEN